MAERRFTELQRRLTIASFLRSLKKKKNRKNNIPKEDVSHVSFVRTALSCYIFLYHDEVSRKKNFFFQRALFIEIAFLWLRLNVFFLGEEKKEISRKKKENVGVAQDNGFSVPRKILYFGHLMYVMRARALAFF